MLDTYFRVNEVKSSCTTLEVVSLDWMSFRASSLIFSIPSFETYQVYEECAHQEYPLLSTKNRLNGENNTVVVALQHLRLDCLQMVRSGGAQKRSCLCRHRQGAISTYKRISRLLCIMSGTTYVFHAPETSITARRPLPASLRYALTVT